MSNDLLCRPPRYSTDDRLALLDTSEWVQERRVLLVDFSDWVVEDFQSPLRTTFDQLAEAWLRETRLLSSVSAIALNENYQRIIGLGQPAIPLILERLSAAPGHWFWALASITRDDPVQAHEQGDIEKMTAAWIAWGEQHGWIRGASKK